MLDSLLDLALKKKDRIQYELENMYDKVPDVSKFWNEYSIIENNQDISISAVDGSRNKKNFLSCVFYVISAETLIYKNDLKKIEHSDIDITPHHRFIEDRLRNYMSLFELKSALNSFEENIDYCLYDGSILGNLIRPISLENELKKDLKEEIKFRYLDDLKFELKSPKVEISSSKFEKDISENFGKIEPVIYLENLENLLVISKFLEERTKIVAISKTSTSNEYFKSEIPDMALFDRNSKKQGYSNPTYISLRDSVDIKREFPVENDFFRNLTFTIFYARLEDNKSILKFELPYKATEDQIKDLIRILKYGCTEGYPYLLKKAHNDVVIKNKDLERLLRMIGLTETGWRGML